MKITIYYKENKSWINSHYYYQIQACAEGTQVTGISDTINGPPGIHELLQLKQQAKDKLIKKIKHNAEVAEAEHKKFLILADEEVEIEVGE